MKNSVSSFWKTLAAEKWLLLLCLVLGFLSWQGIRKNIGFEVSVSNVSVDVDVPEGWAVWEKSVQHVNVLFRGSREDVRYLNSGQLGIVVPLANPSAENEIHIKLLEKHVQNPTGAKVVRFSPAELTVKLDREGELQLPVKATISGALPEGIEIDKMVCTPASVRIAGAEQVLGRMQNIHTEPIKLDGRKTSFKERVRVAPPQAGRLRVDPEWVSVEFSLAQHTSTQEFNNIPVRILCTPAEARRMTLQPRSIGITVQGQERRIKQMRTADIFAYVDCTGLTESTGYDLPVTAHLPSGLKLVKTNPATIHVEIEN